jgi:TonB family protein
MTLFTDIALKVSAIVATALVAIVLLRRSSAALRHWVLSVALTCAAATPALVVFTPWRVTPASWSFDSGAHRAVDVTTTIMPQDATARSRDIAAAAEPEPARRDRAVVIRQILAGIWIGGALLSFVTLFAGLARLARLASGPTRAPAPTWARIAVDLARSCNVRRPIALLESEDAALLVTWGFLRPTIVVPAAAREWTEDRARVVLRHELAHIQRGDWLAQLVGEVVRAIYWFNPLVWIACRRLRQESERACDDAVLESGISAAEYASHLLELARAVSGSRRHLPAPAMARPSSLEGRFHAMFNVRLNRRPLTRSARAATVVLLALLAAGVAAQTRFSTFSGTVLDQTNAAIPEATLVLVNTTSEAKYEVRSDRTGHFEFVGLPAGEYTLGVTHFGFTTFKDTVRVTGSDIDRTIQLEIGNLQETITVSDLAKGRPDPGVAERLLKLQQRAQATAQREAEQCSAANMSATGGNITPPKKLIDVRPEYPEDLKNSKIAGEVKLESVIATDGTVSEVRVLSSPNPDLERAAVDAVRQWAFSTTLLNCVPVEVRMNVSVNFVVH